MKKKRREEKANFVLMLVKFLYLSLFQDTEMGYILLPLESLAVGLRRFPTFFQADRVLSKAQIPYIPYLSSERPGPTHMLGT